MVSLCSSVWDSTYLYLTIVVLFAMKKQLKCKTFHYNLHINTLLIHIGKCILPNNHLNFELNKQF